MKTRITRRIVLLLVLMSCEFIEIFSQNRINEFFKENTSHFFCSDLENINNNNIFSLIFYSLDNKDYVIFDKTDCYSRDRTKLFCFVDTVLFIYYGVNDSIAKKYIKIGNWSSGSINSGSINSSYLNADSLINDPIASPPFYRIKNNKFYRFTPCFRHLKRLDNELIKGGFKLLPPPPPPLLPEEKE